MGSTKVRKLSMDEYQTKYKYNDSAYLRDINTEVSIESKYYKDFFTRLNRIRDFHMTEDTKPRTGKNINKDYYSFFGYPIDSNKKIREVSLSQSGAGGGIRTHGSNQLTQVFKTRRL